MYQYLANEFSVLNKQVESIQYGGCTVFAIGLYELLVKLGKQPNICVISRTPRILERYKNDLFADASLIDIGHVLIEVDGLFLDNTASA